ncbi:hypothetical protein BHM03_00039081 [Ensete ventricosum]|nr:hypothetical protein BHM03_00039081 [Ensete ventricosum]
MRTASSNSYPCPSRGSETVSSSTATATATAAFSPASCYRCGVFLAERWMLRLPLRRRTVTARGISLLLFVLLLFLLRRRTIPFSSLFPFSPQPSCFPEITLLLPSPPSSLFPPFIAAPRPSSPIPPPSSTSSQPPSPVDPDSHLNHAPTPPTLTAPSPFSYSGPDSPLSIILLRPRQPPSPSSTPLFALSIHLPLPFPTS